MSEQKKLYETPELVVMGGLRDIVMLDTDRARDHAALMDEHGDPLS